MPTLDILEVKHFEINILIMLVNKYGKLNLRHFAKQKNLDFVRCKLLLPQAPQNIIHLGKREKPLANQALGK